MDRTQSSAQSREGRRMDIVCQAIAALAARCRIPEEQVVAAIREHFANSLEEMGKAPLVVNNEFREEFREVLGAVLTLWRTGEDYCDSDGEPTEINVRGPAPSVEALYEEGRRNERSVDDVDFEKALEVLLENKAISLVADKKAKLESAAFSINTATTSAVNTQLAYLAEFASTILNNCDTAAGEGRFQMTSASSGFPLEELPRINAMLSSHGFDLIKQVDEFIETAARKNNGKPSTRAGVGLYLFLDNVETADDK